MKKRDLSSVLHCEHMEPTGKDNYYWFPGDVEAGYLCDKCATDNGFCPVCGYFVLGSSDDETLNDFGCCVECLEELKIELGEYDHDDDDFDFYIF